MVTALTISRMPRESSQNSDLFPVSYIIYNKKKSLFIYLAASGLSCDMENLLLGHMLGQ